jgi:hypothetical protein
MLIQEDVTRNTFKGANQVNEGDMVVVFVLVF